MWDPARYERFRPEREQPFWDLLSLVRQRDPDHVVDLGCGTGRLTAELHRELRSRDTAGVDSSPAMLGPARVIAVPGLRFEEADITTWSPPQPVDVVFSNATLQWVDNHPTLFARIAGWLTPHGELAVQMPANFDHPSHGTAVEVAQEEPFATALGGYVRVPPVLQPEAYAALLHDLGFEQQHVRLQVYGHTLESSDAVVEWVRGTLLTDYEARLPAALYEQFIARYRELLSQKLGRQRPYFYAFKRLLLWGLRGSR